MFASGRYHDLILRGSLDVEDYGVTQHVILPLDDYLEEYMPTYFSRLSIDNAGSTLPSELLCRGRFTPPRHEPREIQVIQAVMA